MQRIACAAELHCNTSCCGRWTSPAVGAAVQRIAGAAELQVQRVVPRPVDLTSGGSCSAADLTDGGSCSAAYSGDSGCYDPRELSFAPTAAGRRRCC